VTRSNTASGSAGSLPSAGRDPFFDNVKFLAILLVAAGHAIEWLRDVRAVHAVYLFIYLFHMPVFIMITGYLSRNFGSARARGRKLITSVGVPYVIFETIYSIVDWRLYGGHLTFTLLAPYWLMWFLMALFMWRLSTPIWQQLRWPVAIAVVISLLSGMAGLTELQLNRVLGFLPFYVLGLFLKPAHFELLRRPRVRLVAVAVLAGGLVMTLFVVDRHLSTEWAYWRESNAHFHVNDFTGTLIRLGLLLTSTTLAVAFLAIVPTRRAWFTSLGAATLYAYLLHGFVIMAMRSAGCYDIRWLHTIPGAAVTGLAGIALATVLCTPPARKITRWVIEPNVAWAFKGTRSVTG
jgi:fucose 4-O-acetylase-like acetyltransferase